MINSIFLNFLIAVLLTTTCSAVKSVQPEFKIIKVDADTEKYAKELFSLVENKKYVLDGKNYYNKRFAHRFDQLTVSVSQLVNIPTAAIKKRLLSGPASRAILIRHGNALAGYYDACQAHSCGTIKTNLIYYFDESRLVAKTTWNGKAILFGDPTQQELAMIEKLSKQ